MLMYHLMPKDPEVHGDILLFALMDEPLEKLDDWQQYYKEDHQLIGTFRLTLTGGKETLPGSIGD